MPLDTFSSSIAFLCQLVLPFFAAMDILTEDGVLSRDVLGAAEC